MKKQNGKQPYTSEETRTLLGISSSTLKKLVERGLIEKVVAPGYTHGRYTRESVDQYRREKQTFDQKYSLEDEEKEEEGSNVKMTKVTTLEQMKECQEISQELFGVGRGTEKERMKIVDKNPDTYYLVEKDNQGVGYLSLMPLKKGNLKNVLGQKLPVKIDIDQIENFEEGKQLDLYLTAIGVRQIFSAEETHEYGSMLVRKLIKLVLELGKKGVKIGTIAARSSMPDGIRLMKHAGFTEIPPLTPERRTFIINVEESGIPFILQYKKLLEESKNNEN